ncbi:hypothetical protein [Dickeya ananatis]
MNRKKRGDNAAFFSIDMPVMPDNLLCLTTSPLPCAVSTLNTPSGNPAHSHNTSQQQWSSRDGRAGHVFAINSGFWWFAVSDEQGILGQLK